MQLPTTPWTSASSRNRESPRATQMGSASPKMTLTLPLKSASLPRRQRVHSPVSSSRHECCTASALLLPTLPLLLLLPPLPLPRPPPLLRPPLPLPPPPLLRRRIGPLGDGTAQPTETMQRAQRQSRSTADQCSAAAWSHCGHVARFELAPPSSVSPLRRPPPLRALEDRRSECVCGSKPRDTAQNESPSHHARGSTCSSAHARQSQIAIPSAQIPKTASRPSRRRLWGAIAMSRIA